MDCRQAPSLVCDPSGNIVHEGTTEGSENLFLLPPFAYSETSLEKISGIAREKNAGIVLCSPNHKGQYIYLFRKTGKFQHWEIPTHPLGSNREIPPFRFWAGSRASGVY
jgi:hypothetical protein